MTSKQSARLALRAATGAAHDEVDRAFGTFDLGTRDGYRTFLIAQASAFLPVEAALDQFDPTPVLPDWAERRRADALVADLAALDAPLPPVVEPATYDDVAAALGAIYVLEGSRLGGRMLARAVPPELPRRFLDAGNSLRWRKLIDVLDATLVTTAQLTIAIAAARATFARFEAGAGRYREDLSH